MNAKTLWDAVKNLNGNDFKLYAVICKLADNDVGYCFSSDSNIAEKIGRARETTCRGVNRLIDAGYLNVIKIVTGSKCDERRLYPESCFKNYVIDSQLTLQKTTFVKKRDEEGMEYLEFFNEKNTSDKNVTGKTVVGKRVFTSDENVTGTCDENITGASDENVTVMYSKEKYTKDKDIYIEHDADKEIKKKCVENKNVNTLIGRMSRVIKAGEEITSPIQKNQELLAIEIKMGELVDTGYIDAQTVKNVSKMISEKDMVLADLAVTKAINYIYNSYTNYTNVGDIFYNQVKQNLKAPVQPKSNIRGGKVNVEAHESNRKSEQESDKDKDNKSILQNKFDSLSKHEQEDILAEALILAESKYLKSVAHMMVKVETKFEVIKKRYPDAI